MQSILGCELASTLRMLVRMVEEDTSGGGFEDQLDDKQKPALDTLPCLNDVVPEPRSIALVHFIVIYRLH